MEWREEIKERFEELRQARDELRVQVHLAAAEVKDDWHDLEKKWDRAHAHLKKVEEAAGEAADDVGDALAILGDELKKGYQRIRDAM